MRDTLLITECVVAVNLIYMKKNRTVLILTKYGNKTKYQHENLVWKVEKHQVDHLFVVYQRGFRAC